MWFWWMFLGFTLGIYAGIIWAMHIYERED